MVGARVGAAAAQRALEVLCEDDPSLAAHPGLSDASGAAAPNGVAADATDGPASSQMASGNSPGNADVFVKVFVWRKANVPAMHISGFAKGLLYSVQLQHLHGVTW